MRFRRHVQEVGRILRYTLSTLWRVLKWIAVIACIAAIVSLPFLASFYASLFPEWWGLAADPIPQNSPVTPVIIYAQAKTVWDWLQLLVVPAVLVGVGYWLNRAESDRARKVQHLREAEVQLIEEQRSQDALLREYFDSMTTLLLEKGLRNAAVDDEVTVVANARTVTTFERLDKRRKIIVIRFLAKVGLTSKKKRLVDLRELDLSECELGGLPLQGTDFEKTNFYRAKLHVSDLTGAKLSRTNLTEAYLAAANLSNANLSNANLCRCDLLHAKLVEADLGQADLSGASLAMADLRKACLIGTNLCRANLKDTNLTEAHLGMADMQGANLTGANFDGADLTRAKLTNAIYIKEQFKNARSLEDVVW